MPLHTCLTIFPRSGPAPAFPFHSLHLPLSVLLTCALLLRACVGLLSTLQACKRSSFIHSDMCRHMGRAVASVICCQRHRSQRRRRGRLGCMLVVRGPALASDSHGQLQLSSDSVQDRTFLLQLSLFGPIPGLHDPAGGSIQRLAV